MNRRKVVGFDRKLELEWLDAAAAQVAHRATADEVRKYLWKLLEGSVSAGGQGFNSDRGKTITVLAHIWSEVPEAVAPLRDCAIEALSKASPPERIAIHWSMCLATYPFFGDVAETVGKLLSLQPAATLSEIRQRLIMKWGDRVITKRAAQRIIRSFVAWDVLRDSDRRGVYDPPVARIPVSGLLVEFLLEALLLRQAPQALQARQVETHKALFPFEVNLSPAQVRDSARFTVDLQGMDMEMVRLRE